MDTTAGSDTLCRHIDVVAEGLRAELRRCAEDFNARIDRLESVLREEIGRSHDTLAALIRLADVDLDRRVRVPEGDPPASD